MTGHFAQVFEQEAVTARQTGRMSDKGIDALWNLDPQAARELLGRSGLSRPVQRSVAAQLPGAPATVPVRLVAAGLLAIQLAEIAAREDGNIMGLGGNGSPKPKTDGKPERAPLKSNSNRDWVRRALESGAGR